MAGAEGFEPPKAVLETAGLPLAYAPTRAAITFSLLDFPVYPVYAAKGAEFLQLQPFGLGLLVLGFAVVLVFALGALHRDNFAHSFCSRRSRTRYMRETRNVNCSPYSRYSLSSSYSRFLFYPNISVTVPAPTVRPPSRSARRSPLCTGAHGDYP